MNDLAPFAEHDVTECAVQITNAGDGLSESLDIAPVELDHGETVYVVLRGTVSKVAFVPIKDTDELRRVHTIKTTFGTLVDEASARAILNGARRKVDEARGVQEIPFDDEDEDGDG